MSRRLLALYTSIIKRIYKEMLIFEYILKDNKHNKKNLFRSEYYNRIKLYSGKRVYKPP